MEFALLLPLLAILVFGTVDLGRAYQLKNQLKNAAREGAAYAQVYPLRQQTTGACAAPNNIRYRAQSELGDGTGTGFTITITPATGCNVASTSLEPGDEVTVSASRSFDVFTPLVGAITGDPINITESVTVVIQG